jgi:hypothetical protein
MRRTFLTALVLGAVLGAPTAQAAPSAQLRDKAGDWAVPSQDVLSGRLSSARVAGKPVLRGELRLAAAPAAGVVTTYHFGFGIGCHNYSFGYVWPGAAQAAQASLDYYDFCTERDGTRQLPDKTYVATVTVRGSTIVWQAAYAGHIVRGARVAGFSAIACPVLGGIAGGGTNVPNTEVWTGDVAWSQGRYVVGSDLPRK